ncbi:MAG: acyl-CoA dehydrogenase family protein [Deltaproteobacteria bacterium]|nr:acyl-CoA dehydrogenase family protein [Deltaproteobacteria bacterium]
MYEMTTEASVELSEELKLLQDTLKRFVHKEVVPQAEQIDDEDRFPRDLMFGLGRLGLLGITVPEKYGGSGAGLLAQAIVVEELARASAGLASSYAAHSNLVADNLNRHANHYQKEKYLPSLCSGDKIGCLAITEPGSGSDALAMRTRAVRDGDHYVLNGTKIFITNGPVADIIVTYAKTAPEKGSRGISTFIVEKEFEGFSVGRKIDKLGHKGSPFGELVFNDCRVPAQNMVGEENSMVHMLMSGLHRERIVWSSEAVGIAQGAYDIASKYAKEREQFNKPIGEFQMIQEKLVDMALDIHIGRVLVRRCAKMAEVQNHGDVGLEASYAKLFCGDMSERVTSKALHILGGYGYTKEFQVERFYRDAKAMPIGAGTSEIQRLIIARKLLR